MASPTSDPLTDTQVEVLVFGLHRWAERHPYPDTPLLAFAGVTPVTPRQMASEIEARSDSGLALLRMFQFGLEMMPFDDLLGRFIEIEPVR